MRLKKRRFILAVIFLIIIIYLLFKIIGFIFNPNSTIILKPKSSLEEYTKITVTPLPFKKQKNISFLIKIETTQNPELLNIDYSHTAFLEDEKNNIVEPLIWEAYKRENNKTEGKLIFPYKYSNQKRIKLILFKWSDNNFTWEIKK